MTESSLTHTDSELARPVESSETPPRPIVYISWAESCSRSDHTARELGGKSFMVYLGFLGSHPLTVPLKYLGQFVMTLWILVRERPRAVFVMSPPLVAACPAYLYRLITGAPFVMDCHTAAYLHPRWKRLQWLQHWLGRRAATNIVTNEHLAELVREHGGRATIVRDVPVVYEGRESYPLRDGFCVAVVCSFNPDEPVAEIFEAAREIPAVTLYVTGKTKHLPPDTAARKPDNVILTGFVSDDAFGDLISRTGAVMSLTTRDHTMLRGAWEAIYQATPVIVSDWPCLREAFSQGAVFTDNTARGIAEAIRQVQHEHRRLNDEAEMARRERVTRWRQVREALLQAVGMEK